MNAYQLEVNGETEIVAANTIFEAIKYYASLNDLSLSDFDNNDTIEEIQPQTWNDFTIRNTDFDPNDKDDKEEFTLSEMMEGIVEPELISTTNQ